MSAQTKRIKCVDKLGVLLQKKKRIKMLVGGRASTKSTFVADAVLAKVSGGETWCCGREFQNSIDDSVHSMMKGEIERCGFHGFDYKANRILHSSGGEIFYKGLARNITSLKGLNNLKGLWIEEGESLSAETIKVLTASVRLSAAEAAKLKLEGKSLDVPEIWITLNRGSSKDPIAQKFLARAEKELSRCGYYEDDALMIVEINYPDVPKSWFLESGLEQERLDDERNMTRAEYRHKWHGEYSDTIDNAIIDPDWFDACIDAHVKLGIDAVGQERVAYDPADTGDAKAVGYMHGVVVKDVQQTNQGLIDTATDWACSFANDIKPDVFTWDCDGMGAGLSRQISEAFSGKKIEVVQFKGSEAADRPDAIPDSQQHVKDPKSNKQLYINKRAQYYFELRDRMKRTFLAVTQGKYVNPDEIISFSSEIKDIGQLRAEVCRIPRKFASSGRLQLMTKAEMLKMGIDSPNMSDVVMMLMRDVEINSESYEIQYETW